MVDASKIIVSTPNDDYLAAYDLKTYPPTDPVSKVFQFDPGFGRDTLAVDVSAYYSPGGGYVPQVAPYTIKLGAGITPDDINLVMDVDTYHLAQPYPGNIYSREESGWTVTWELKVKHTADSITVSDFIADGTLDPAHLHDALRGLVQIEFADGTVWSADQVRDKLMQPVTPPVTLQGTDGNDSFEPGQANDVIDLGAGAGVDTLTAWRGDGNDTVHGELDVLRLRGGIQRGDLQFYSTGQVFVMEKGRAVYSLTADAIDSIVFDDGSTMSAGDIQQAVFSGSPLNDTIQGTSGADHITGRDGSDSISGGAGNDTLEGNAGSNWLSGDDGDDTLISEGDNDTLIGGAGADTFVTHWGRYGATRVIDDVGGDSGDKLVLDSASNEVTVRSMTLGDTTSLVITRTSDPYGTSSIRLDNFFGANAGQTSIGAVRFKDGVTWDAATLYKAAMTGGSGNDYIQGSAWNDTISGGGGVDTLVGGAGNDTYRYERGDGFDFIQLHDDGAGDVLELGAGITQNDFVVLVYPDPGSQTLLELVFKDGSGGIRMGNEAVSGTGSTVAMLPSIKLANGTVLKLGDLHPIAFSTVGTSGADTLWADVSYANVDGTIQGAPLSGGKGNDVLNGNIGNDYLEGGDGNDTLRGGQGSDMLIGGKGNDTYLFARGDGQDTIVDNDGTWFNTDVLKLSGITSRQVWLAKDADTTSLDIIVIGTGDKIVVKDWFTSTSNRVEKIVASDGKTLNAAKVQNLVNAMASFSPPALGQTTLPADTPASITRVVASSWN
jgi:Ca2+-binding RTX toxin-like protein